MSITHLQGTAKKKPRSKIGKIIAILFYVSSSIILLYLIILFVVLSNGGDTFCMGFPGEDCS